MGRRVMGPVKEIAPRNILIKKETNKQSKRSGNAIR
jgi:hypothetical protein